MENCVSTHGMEVHETESRRGEVDVYTHYEMDGIIHLKTVCHTKLPPICIPGRDEATVSLNIEGAKQLISLLQEAINDVQSKEYTPKGRFLRLIKDE